MRGAILALIILGAVSPVLANERDPCGTSGCGGMSAQVNPPVPIGGTHPAPGGGIGDTITRPVELRPGDILVVTPSGTIERIWPKR